MRIYYRSQHIHTFDDNSVPMKVEICVEKDRLHIKWHDHIQTAINKISIAAPGIQFIRTDSKEPSNESTNYIKIGIDNPILKDEVYTCFTNGYPLVHLGEEWDGNSKAGTSIHEILHALGFGHIMERFDSNLYLNVKTDGLDSNHAYQYTSNPSYGMLTRFDPFSIMMYSENDYMKRAEGDKIWDLKKGPERLQEMSELDKVALNLMYKPCKSNSEYPYSPVLSESTNMLYCGRDVMKSHNQNVPPTISSKCGPNIWANCPSCRVFKDLKNSYRFGTTILSDGVCGPDQGIPCTDCGKQLKPDYSYTDFNPIPVNRMTDDSTTSSMSSD
ncbi:unnamed protein product [Mytilus edulis]|uniref:Metalloendopeptidase n=1 Tax=Mytilus edulis TaxID=6550 RepID=A0A8S3RMX4_MYTED|nr:unnamed protein product [Mytilus edulis]